jgi:hypothetical protein
VSAELSSRRFCSFMRELSSRPRRFRSSTVRYKRSDDALTESSTGEVSRPSSGSRVML